MTEEWRKNYINSSRDLINAKRFIHVVTQIDDGALSEIIEIRLREMCQVFVEGVLSIRIHWLAAWIKFG